MANETKVNSEDETLKKSMTLLMVGLFSVFFGLVILAGEVAA